MRSLLHASLTTILILGAACSDRTEPAIPMERATANFALGCYWCAQHAFDGLEGVVAVTAGHVGEGTEWREAVEVEFDPQIVTYQNLLEHFWLNVDPLDADGQFCDRGSEYRSGIFVRDESQRQLAEASKQRIEKEKRWEVETSIVEAGGFEPVRESEQFYYRKHPVRYRFYRLNCGRDARLHELWGEHAGGKAADH